MIAGPRAGKLQPDPQGSGFFFLSAESEASASVAEAALRRLHCEWSLLKLLLSQGSKGLRNGLDHPDARRDLHWARDQRLPAG